MALAAHSYPAQAATEIPVLLLHGFASSGVEDFVSTGWIKALHAAGRSVTVIDLPGHGDSSAISSPVEASTDRVVSSILETATSATSGAFDVIAYSLGSRLAWELPAVSAAPRRLVLGGLSPFDPFSTIDPPVLARALAGGEPENSLVDIMATIISAPGRDTASLAHLIEGLASQPFDPSTGGPTIPTLFAAGDADEMTAGVTELVDALPNASLASVPGDHRGALDSAEFRSAAIDFLNA